MITSESLIEQVRDITNEVNTKTVSDDLILRMLSRAQQDMVTLTMKRYAPRYMMEVVLTQSDFNQMDTSGTYRIADLPPLSFGFAINEVAASLGQTWILVKNQPFFATTYLDFQSGGSLPTAYSVMGNKIYIYPSMMGGSKIRIRYQFRPPQLVKSSGRIIGFDAEAGTMELYGMSELSTDVNSLAAFYNIVDPLTGAIKATVQLNGIDTKVSEVSIKTTDLDRESVYGMTVASALPGNIAVDDLICPAKGVCVPYLAADLTNFLVELAAFNTKRSLLRISQEDYSERDRVIEAVGTLWSGRENTGMIRKHKSLNSFSPQWLFRGAN